MMFTMASSPGSGSEASRIAAQLRADIVDGVRAPGSKLVERDVAAAMGVSRVPVRDALKILVAEGLVTLRPRTWAVVREFSEREVADLFEAREALDSLAFRLATSRRTPEGMERLRSAVDTETRAAEAGDVRTARRLAADFHELVIELAGNTVLTELAETTRSRMRWLLSQHDDVQDVARQHAGLCDAIAAGDHLLVVRLAAEHLAHSREMQRNFI